MNAELRSCISDLEAQLVQVRDHHHQGPLSSTPYRHTQSLHDEILGQESLKDGEGSPVSPLQFSGLDSDGVPPHREEISRTIQKELQVSPAMESLAKLVDKTVSLMYTVECPD